MYQAACPMCREAHDLKPRVRSPTGALVECTIEDCPVAQQLRAEAHRLKQQINGVARDEKADFVHLNELIDSLRTMALALQAQAARHDAHMKLLGPMIQEREAHRAAIAQQQEALSKLAQEEHEHHEETQEIHEPGAAAGREERLDRLEQALRLVLDKLGTLGGN